MKIHTYAAKIRGAKLLPFEYDRREPLPNEIEVQVTHCGMCHSDLHLVNDDFKMSSYPLVPGHEVIGTVSQLGKNVISLQLGDRVGIGWQCGSCGHCKNCRNGDENYCSESRGVCVEQYGGYADYTYADSSFAFKIPEKLKSPDAAPLLCGGITVYSPIRRYAQPGMKVGVIGIGGLGHFALQFAHALGCEVTAFSSTPAKEKEAKSFGAHHFVVNQDKKQMARMKETQDFIISTVNQPVSWDDYLAALNLRGTLCLVGVPKEKIKIAAFSLLKNERKLAGSIIGNRKNIQEMLEFSAEHGIRAQTEILPLKDCNKGFQKLRKNQVRYRMVLKIKG